MNREEYRQRVEALSRRYPYLFSETPIGTSIAPGWLALVERLCARIDGALAEAEKSSVHILQIKEKFGALRFYLNVLPPRFDFIAPGHVASVQVVPDDDPPEQRALYARLAPLVADAERTSAETCLFCGAPGQLRRNRAWILTLCDRHSNFTYHHLEAAFEQMTEPNGEVTPPSRQTVITALNGAVDAFRALGLTRLGILTPESAASVWRLAGVGSLGFEACRLAETLLHWPFEAEYGFRDRHRKAGPDEVTWIFGGKP